MKALRSVLPRYVVSATAARTANEGVATALALIVLASGRHAGFAGLLLSAAALPHVLVGPVAGAALDSSPHRRRLLVAAPVVFAVGIAGSGFSVGRLPAAISIAVAALAGCAGPLLLGGLTAELTLLVPESQGRALALDGMTYNVAAVAGPAAVGAVAGLSGPTGGLVALVACAGLAAVGIASLPNPPRAVERPTGTHVLDGVRRLWSAPPLRAITAGTTVAFAGAGAISLLVIARADELGRPAVGALLLGGMAVAAFASGVVVATRFAVGRYERRVFLGLVVLGVALALAALADGIILLAVGLVVAGAADGVLFPALLAVRAEHSKEGERGAVFTTAASLKIAASAGGTAGLGAVAGAVGAAPALWIAAALHGVGAAICVRYAVARPVVLSTPA